MWHLVLLLWLGVLFAISVIFSMQNSQLVTFALGWKHINLPLAVLLLVFLGLGVLLGFIANLAWLWRLRQQKQRLQRRYQHALQQLHTNTASMQDNAPE